MRAVLWGILWCSLLFGCITDLKSQRVYNFTWWFGGLAAGGLLWKSLCPGKAEVLWQLALFMALQMWMFSRMYGKADCYAFCVCAIAEAALGMGFRGYLKLMLLALMLLFPVQLFRRNIARDGNLRHPVAFLPYISVAFGLHIAVIHTGNCPAISFMNYRMHIYANIGCFFN